MFIFSHAIISVTLLLTYCPAWQSQTLCHSYAVHGRTKWWWWWWQNWL